MYSIHGQRNPLLSFSDTLSNNSFIIQTIGDPHIGKQFKNNVPKHKLGVRESLVISDFHKLLDSSANVVVICGDLFDKTNIDNSTLLNCISSLEYYCSLNTKTSYFILAGNHDLSKNKNIKSSFDILTKYFNSRNLPNLTIVSDKIITKKSDLFKINLVFCPYFPIENDIDYSSYLRENYQNIIFGHWELTDFNSFSDASKYTSNVIPEELFENNNLIITGHEHTPKAVKKDNYEVIVTGSLQPYSHAEVLDEEVLYVTHTIEEVSKNIQSNPEFYSDKNLRILLHIDDVLPDLKNNYLSVSYKYLNKNVQEVEEVQDISNNSPLSFSDMFYDYLKNNPSSISKYIETTYLNKDYSEWKFSNESN